MLVSNSFDSLCNSSISGYSNEEGHQVLSTNVQLGRGLLHTATSSQKVAETDEEVLMLCLLNPFGDDAIKNEDYFVNDDENMRKARWIFRRIGLRKSSRMMKLNKKQKKEKGRVVHRPGKKLRKKKKNSYVLSFFKSKKRKAKTQLVLDASTTDPKSCEHMHEIV